MNGDSMGVVAVIPIKPPSQAKSRLAPFLDEPRRQRLVLNMLRHVIKAATEAVDEVWVLGADSVTEELAKTEGAQWHREEGTNVNESLEIVFKQVWSAGKSPLFLPGDLPYVQGAELRELMAQATGKESAVLAPAKNGGGTNAILLPKPSEFRMLLGPGSFRRHLAQGDSLGLDIAIHNSPGLAQDLDTWEDVQAYQRIEPGLLERLTGKEA